MKQMKVVSSSELVTNNSRRAPSDIILDSVEGDYKTMRQVAELIGIHTETLRRLCRTDKVKAPSNAVQSGNMTIYLFNPEDVEEVKAYFSKKGYVIGDE